MNASLCIITAKSKKNNALIKAFEDAQELHMNRNTSTVQINTTSINFDDINNDNLLH